jgi:hypothetical protein
MRASQVQQTSITSKRSDRIYWRIQIDRPTKNTQSSMEAKSFRSALRQEGVVWQGLGA